ncbi:hypothetical protein CC78DRAFT_587291 [Lojkania enalia]|uniref:Uncharacterized protein n=1 Tax=Lojkania enalia TaxID=147567 RepID=A0A9P4K081_9PLEO|nr:hypothetical protein CC78DRAFT_587291 [Didymosphaeria enalia]
MGQNPGVRTRPLGLISTPKNPVNSTENKPRRFILRLGSAEHSNVDDYEPHQQLGCTSDGFIKSTPILLRSDCSDGVAKPKFHSTKGHDRRIHALIHEVDDIPPTAWLLTFTGALSQLARYGITVAWQNYLQNPRDGVMPGALELGQAKATTIRDAYLFFQYLTPSVFAVVLDAWIGRYKTIMLSLALLVVGYLMSMLTALSATLEYGAGVGGLAAAMVFIGLGQGGISAIQYPFIRDQIPEIETRVKKNKRGELVAMNQKLTIQYVFNGYYWMVNVASLFSIPTALMEKHIDFWAVYLLPICIPIVSTAPVIICKKRLVKLPPQGNVLPHASQVIWIAIRSRFRLTAANPEYRAAPHKHDVL